MQWRWHIQSGTKVYRSGKEEIPLEFLILTEKEIEKTRRKKGKKTFLRVGPDLIYNKNVDGTTNSFSGALTGMLELKIFRKKSTFAHTNSKRWIRWNVAKIANGYFRNPIEKDVKIDFFHFMLLLLLPYDGSTIVVVIVDESDVDFDCTSS